MKTKAIAIKICPSCKKSFECIVDIHLQCKCFSVKLTDAHRDYLRERHKDCLCIDCLQKIAKK